MDGAKCRVSWRGLIMRKDCQTAAENKLGLGKTSTAASHGLKRYLPVAERYGLSGPQPTRPRSPSPPGARTGRTAHWGRGTKRACRHNLRRSLVSPIAQTSGPLRSPALSSASLQLNPLSLMPARRREGSIRPRARLELALLLSIQRSHMRRDWYYREERRIRHWQIVMTGST